MTASPEAVAAAVADAHRREWAFVLAATVRVTRDLDVAEECVQDAFATALTSWRKAGVPARPGAWLTTTSRRRALDVLRRETVARRMQPLLLMDGTVSSAEDVVAEGGDGGRFPDDRLRLVVTCCHPALGQPAQVALTLRLVCGLSTAEVARAFLVSEATMAARITRAKKKIELARIPYRVPAAAELPGRVAGVLAVVHLLFTTGHTAPAGAALVRRELVERAVDLARMLRAMVAGPVAGPAAGLAAVEALSAEPQLARYSYLPATRADLLRRLGRLPDAVAAYRQALALTANASERAFLTRRVRECGGAG